MTPSTFKIVLREQRAQLVIKELNNETRIISEPDAEGWVKVEVVLRNSYDALCLYHAGMAARAQMDAEFEASQKAA